jgi:thiol-disulfide isomerase/thioredoxin
VGSTPFLAAAASALLLGAAAPGGGAPPPGDPGICGPAAACPPPEDATLALPPARSEPGVRAVLTVYWGENCPHCEEARPAVAALAAADPRVTVEWVEVRRDAAGRARFREEVARRGLAGAGVPTFVAGGEALVGFRAGETERELAALVARALGGGGERGTRVRLPLVGELDGARLPLAFFTVAVGLVDGVNPCAMYVLVVLLGILLHAGSRARMALYGGAFVAISGIVYFLFMTAWLGAFSLGGLSRPLTAGLGAVLVGMGLLNLKDAIWLGRGPSLSVPDAAKPGLHRRMRAVAAAASLPAGLAGVAALAFVVNLVELGCTLGLPAVYTRVLSLRTDVGPGGRLAWLALYNLAYVVPLGLIVAVCAVTLRRLVMSPRAARILKAVSGGLLVAFGATFLLAPGLLE